MLEMVANDIFDLPYGTQEAVLITTNGIVRTNGYAVMGRGIAECADARFHVAKLLGSYIKSNGNNPYYLGFHTWNHASFNLISYPTKNHWRDDSDLLLIYESSKKIVEIANQMNLRKIYSVRPGCSNGHLDWNSQVKPIIETIFDDRFIIVTQH